MSTQANYEQCTERHGCMCKRCVAFHDARVRREVEAENARRRAQMFAVHVWFATSNDYRCVAKRDDELAAMREARAYLSDSRGIRVVKPNGEVIQVK